MQHYISWSNILQRIFQNLLLEDVILESLISTYVYIDKDHLSKPNLVMLLYKVSATSARIYVCFQCFFLCVEVNELNQTTKGVNGQVSCPIFSIEWNSTFTTGYDTSSGLVEPFCMHFQHFELKFWYKSKPYPLADDGTEIFFCLETKKMACARRAICSNIVVLCHGVIKWETLFF